MTLDGTYRAVLDRVEDGVGVLLIEADDEVVDERDVDPDVLPSDASDGAIFDATFASGTLEELAHRPDATERRRRDVQSRFDDLAERPPGRDGEERDD